MVVHFYYEAEISPLISPHYFCYSEGLSYVKPLSLFGGYYVICLLAQEGGLCEVLT